MSLVNSTAVTSKTVQTGRFSTLKHRPLATNNAIRLLRVVRSTNIGAPIVCSLVHTCLSTAPVYRALSYAWGPSEPTHAIAVNGYSFHVRQNLFDFLKVAQQGLNSGTSDISLLWIDQICIDQQNQRERGHQVGMMSAIFTSASEVIMWMGLSNVNTDFFISQMSRMEKLDAESRLEHIRSIQDDPRYSLGISDIITRPYWERVWTMQEWMLGRRCTLYCGESYMLTDLLYDMWSSLQGSQQVRQDMHHFLAMYVRRPTPTSWYHVLLLSCGTLCSEPQDKLYALNGLVDESVRLDTDYSKTTEEVLDEVCRKQRTSGLYMPNMEQFRREWELELESYELPFREKPDAFMNRLRSSLPWPTP